MSLASAQNVAEVEHLISFQRETSVGRRCRVISTFGVLAGVTAVIVTVALVLFIGGASRSRRPSSLEEFRITVVPLERPQWFVNALNSNKARYFLSQCESQGDADRGVVGTHLGALV